MTPPKIIVAKEFLLIKALLTVVYIILEVYYNYFISAQYAYMGFVPDLSIFKYAITKLVFISLLVLSHSIYKRSRFLYSMYSLLIFFFYIPVAILFSCSNLSVGPFASTTFFVAFFALSPYIKFHLPEWSLPDKIKPIALFGLSVLLMIPIVIMFGKNINLRTLALSEIYETREAFSKNLHGILAYFYNLEAKTIIPAALVFFFVRKRFFLAASLILLLLYLYVISGNKIVYFTSIIVVFFFFTGRTPVAKLSNFLLLMLLLFVAFPILDNFILSTPLLAGTFVNRLLFIPALTTNFYFDFFDAHPFFFAESHFFSHFFKSPYELPVGFLITDVYWNEPDVYANTGIVSDGFMNLGYSGVLLFSAAFTLLFSLFNSLNLHKGYFGLYFSYLFLILSVPFLSSLVTGGILLFIVLGIFILNEHSKNDRLRPSAL